MPTILFEQDARDAIQKGVSTLARTVRSTLGPRGRNVMIAKSFGPPLITKDGVTVAREIVLEDSYENVGAQMVRDAASTTNEAAGDGTTTATVLAHAIFKEGLKIVTAGVNSVQLNLGIQRCVRDVVENLRSSSIPVKDQTAMAQVASIAANNNSEIGNLIAETITKVGEQGVVVIEEGKSLADEVEYLEGMQFDNGYLSPYFVSDVSQMECVLEEPYVLICESKVSRVEELLPLLELVSKSGKPILIVAEDVTGDALSLLVLNHLRGSFHSCAVKAPGYGDRRKAVLDDLAIVTGGQAVMEGLGIKLENHTLDSLGRADRIVISKDKTTIIGGAGKKASIKKRISQIESEVVKSTNDHDREQLLLRKARLTGGVAKISVGGSTEPEVKQKKMLYDDALNATRAATEEGVLPGGGVALLRASQSCSPNGLSDDETAGYKIVLRACRSPLFWIASNAGQDGGIVVEHVLEGTGSHGFNALNNNYEDLVAAGILDATKVVRSALQSAASVSALLLSSGAIISKTAKQG